MLVKPALERVCDGLTRYSGEPFSDATNTGRSSMNMEMDPGLHGKEAQKESRGGCGSAGGKKKRINPVRADRDKAE